MATHELKTDPDVFDAVADGLALPIPMPLIKEAMDALGLSRAFFAECEAEARDVMRNRSEK